MSDFIDFVGNLYSVFSLIVVVLVFVGGACMPLFVVPFFPTSLLQCRFTNGRLRTISFSVSVYTFLPNKFSRKTKIRMLLM